jgi:spore germination protein KC
MKNNKKAVILIILLCLSFISMTGCYDRREVDDLVYPVAIGLDKGKTNYLRMTLQLAVPTSIGSGGEVGSGEVGKSVGITTVETPSIYSGLNMINTYVSKQINMSHVKAIVFSQELAQEGIEKYIYAFMRGREFRPNAYVMVARGQGNAAEKYLRSVKPEFETNPAKYYEMVLSAYKYTGFTADTTLISFYHKMGSKAIQPVAVLAGVSKFSETEDIDIVNSTYMEKNRSPEYQGGQYPLEGDFMAGDMPKVGSVKSEVMGLAVFNNSKLVGELDGQETTYNLMGRGEFGHSYMSIPDPKSEGKFVLLNVKQSRSPKKSVMMEGDEPKISIKIILEADILSIQSGINYEDMKHVRILEKFTEEFLKSAIERFLKKTAEENNADTCGFGMVMKRKFLTWRDWEDFGWEKKYENSTFNVEVDLKIRRPGLIIRTVEDVVEEEEVAE